MDTIITLNSSEAFAELIAADLCLALFGTPWSPPCIEQEEILKHLAKEMGEAAPVILRVDANLHGRLADSYQVHSVPTLLLFSQGQEVQRLLGLQPLASLKAALSEDGPKAEAESAFIPAEVRSFFSKKEQR